MDPGSARLRAPCPHSYGHPAQARATLSRRAVLASLSLLGESRSQHRVAVFSAEVTPPLGHPLFAGFYAPALKIEDPLYALGLVLAGPQAPLVILAIDFLEIRNESYVRWRRALAEAAGTTPERVLVTSVHQHNTPLADRVAQELLEKYQVPGKICDERYHEQCVQRVAGELRRSLTRARPITHIGLGQAKVQRVASNRRAVLPGGKISFARASSTPDPVVRNAPEGLIDPWLKTISFWENDRPLAALSSYSVHAQTHFGKGGVTADFLGWARSRRQKETPGTAQLYAPGCSGDTVAGKYNDGDPRNWPELSARVHRAMREAWDSTRRTPFEGCRFHAASLRLGTRETGGYSKRDQLRTLADPAQPYMKRAVAAMGLSWRSRIEAGHAIDIPVIDFGPATILLLPGETFVQYQLWAQQLRPGQFVMALGFGECVPGYIPTRAAMAEGWDDIWMWDDTDSAETIMRDTLAKALGR